MKRTLSIVVALIAMSGCKNETTDKLKEASNNISNVTSILSDAQEVQEESSKLKELTPMTNDALKAWLPENLGDLTRTGYKVGKTGYLNVSSIEGTFKNEDGRELQLEIMDGAGEMGSVLMTSMSMAHNMEVEEEDENKHLQTLTRDGIKVKQTYFKKRNKTELQFIYGQRFVVMVKAQDMDPEDTWNLVEELDLEDLED